MQIKRAISVALLFMSSGIALADEPGGLLDRAASYFETAVAVIHEETEVLEKNGRKYRVLFQDTETGELKPKIRSRRGTGFFLFHDGDYYFATAQHVARIMKPNSRIAFVNSLGESRGFVLAKLVGNQEKFVWRHHTEADVSLMKLYLPEHGVEEIAELAILTKDLYLEVPPRTAKMVVAGYPGGLGTRGGNISPITAVVHLASEEIHLGVKLEGISIESAYLVNPPAGKGYSGAPIFYTLADGQVKCASVLNGAWSDPTGGKFSISTPARYLLSLVND